MNQIHSGFVELGKDVQSLTEENSLLTLLPPKSGPILYTQLLIISFYCLKHLWSSAYLKHVFKVLPISLKLQNTTVQWIHLSHYVLDPRVEIARIYFAKTEILPIVRNTIAALVPQTGRQHNMQALLKDRKDYVLKGNGLNLRKSQLKVFLSEVTSRQRNYT